MKCQKKFKLFNMTKTIDQEKPIEGNTKFEQCETYFIQFTKKYKYIFACTNKELTEMKTIFKQTENFLRVYNR